MARGEKIKMTENHRRMSVTLMGVALGIGAVAFGVAASGRIEFSRPAVALLYLGPAGFLLLAGALIALGLHFGQDWAGKAAGLLGLGVMIYAVRGMVRLLCWDLPALRIGDVVGVSRGVAVLLAAVVLWAAALIYYASSSGSARAE